MGVPRLAGSTSIPAPTVPASAVHPTALRCGDHIRRRRGGARRGRRSWYDVAAGEDRGDQAQKKHQRHDALHRLLLTGRPAVRASGSTWSRAVRSVSRWSQRGPPPLRSGSSGRILAGHPEPRAPGSDPRRTAGEPGADYTAGTAARRPEKYRATRHNSRRVQPHRDSGETSRSKSASFGHHDAPEGVPCHGVPPCLDSRLDAWGCPFIRA
jgi:hypothetical protein